MNPNVFWIVFFSGCLAVVQILIERREARVAKERAALLAAKEKANATALLAAKDADPGPLDTPEALRKALRNPVLSASKTLDRVQDAFERMERERIERKEEK